MELVTFMATDVTAAPSSVSFGGSEVNRYAANDSIGWSAESDRYLTSSAEFNKLQQTNVRNYENLVTQ